MKTLADLKRNAQNYSWEMIFNSWFGGDLKEGQKFYKLQRTVGKVQTNSLAFNTNGRLSWLDWPKASEIDIIPYDNENGAFVVLITPSDEKECAMRYVLRPITN